MLIVQCLRFIVQYLASADRGLALASADRGLALASADRGLALATRGENLVREKIWPRTGGDQVIK